MVYVQNIRKNIRGNFFEKLLLPIRTGKLILFATGNDFQHFLWFFEYENI